MSTTPRARRRSSPSAARPSRSTSPTPRRWPFRAPRATRTARQPRPSKATHDDRGRPHPRGWGRPLSSSLGAVCPTRSAIWWPKGLFPTTSPMSRTHGFGADAGAMALGDHPMRTPVYGGLLIVGAMLGATVVWQGGLPSWLRNALLVLALVAALAGWLMTFRDLSPSRRRRGRP